MTISNYRNFDLLITRAGERYRAFVVDSPAGEASVLFDLPFAADELTGLGGLARGVHRGSGAADDTGPAASLTGLGSRLFAAVFRDKVATLLAASLSSVAQEGAGLRLRLRFEEDAAGLAALPWETLYDPGQGHFVGLGEQSPILRYFSLPRSRSALLVEPPLRVLAVLAGPAGLAPLNLDREWQTIQGALAGLVADDKFVLERLATPSLAALQERLSGEPVHILHFVGHGVFDEASQNGSLVLEDAQGRPQFVRGEQLAAVLRDRSALRLVYLNACEGALASGQSVFTGVAQTLVREGVPAAVAMQAEISDTGAIALARTFYTELAAGRPVDTALTQARVALSAAPSPEWAIPVLFSRSPDNRLFDIREVLPTPNCPYPGMAHFTEAQKDLFFGREREIEDAVERLHQQPFLAVVGPSGSGKSSLIRAGVIPALRKSRRFGAGQWDVKIMRPGQEPVAALAEELGCSPETLPSVVFAGHTLLFVDQFEELFTLAEAGEAQAFLDALQALIKRPNLYVLLTVRADFYPDLMACSLWPLIRANRLELTPLGDDELWTAIVEPAARVGVTVDEALAVRLIADAAGESALPLVQETLVLLWDKVVRGQLGLAAYRGMAEGGRSGLQVAIDRRASSIYENLPDAAQPIARRIFLRLIQFGEGRADTRRQQTADELRASGDNPALFDSTLARLTESRLLTAGGEAGDPDRRVDIAHEALIAGWPRLQGWLSDRRAAEQIRRRLEAKATEWVAGEKRGGLLDEYELQEAEHWLAGEDAGELGHSHALVDLVHASKEAIAQATTEKQAQRQRELEQTQKLAEEQRLRAEEGEKAASRLRKRLIAATVAVVIAAVAFAAAAWFGADASRQRNKAEVALVTATVAQGQAEIEAENAMAAQATAEAETMRADQQAQEAERQAAVARARQLAAQSSKELVDNHYEPAVLLAIEAGRAAEELDVGAQEAFDAIRATIDHPGRSTRVLYGHTDDVKQATWSRDESRVLTVGADSTARIWDAVSGVELVKLEGVYEAMWSQDESKILVNQLDDTVRIWDAVTGTELTRLEGRNDDVTAVMWSRDGAKILTRGFSVVRIWDAATGAKLISLTGHEGHINQVTWSQGESRVLTASDDDTVRIWDVATGVEEVKIEGHGSAVRHALWSRYETEVLTASLDGTARIWDAATGTELVRFAGHTGEVKQAVWNKDETEVLTASSDGTTRVWDVVTGDELLRMGGHTFDVSQAMWSQDGSKILTTSADNIVHIWDATSGVELEEFQGHEGIVRNAIWSRKTTSVLTSGEDITARIWDAATGVELIALGGHADFVSQVTWSQDESKVLTAGLDHSARIWNVSAGTELPAIDGYRNVISQPPMWIQDESMVLTCSDDGIVRIVEIATGTELVRMQGHTGFITQATLSLDGSKVLTASDDETARIWDATTGVELVRLDGHHSGAFYGAAWSEDEERVVTADSDGTIRVWDATSGAELVRPQGHVGVILARTKDGLKVLTAGKDGTDWIVRIWNAASGTELVRLEGHSSFVSRATWSQDETRVLTASYDGTARIWDAASGAELVRLKGHTDYVQEATWSEDEMRVLTANNDGTARIWDAASGTELVRMEGHVGAVTQATWSKDGTKVLSVGPHDVRIWDAVTGTELARLEGHEDYIRQAMWSRDGSRVLTADRDGTIRIWYVHMKDLVAAVCHRVPRNFTWDEWSRLVRGEYRPTCREAPIPPDVVQAIHSVAKDFALEGDSDTARARLDQLNSWLADSGQFNSYGVDPAVFIKEVQSIGSD